jgi:hypothetical protein
MEHLDLKSQRPTRLQINNRKQQPYQQTGNIGLRRDAGT